MTGSKSGYKGPELTQTMRGCLEQIYKKTICMRQKKHQLLQ